jgi:hypothetical protein
MYLRTGCAVMPDPQLGSRTESAPLLGLGPALDIILQRLLMYDLALIRDGWVTSIVADDKSHLL